jgi:hypothetical protein
MLADASSKQLNQFLAESIDEVLEDLLGKKTRQAIYEYLARECSLVKEEIPQNIDKFFHATEEAFGKGSRTIARCTVRKLFGKLGWKYEIIGGFEFSDYLDFARGRIARELLENAKASSNIQKPE